MSASEGMRPRCASWLAICTVCLRRCAPGDPMPPIGPLGLLRISDPCDDMGRRAPTPALTSDGAELLRRIVAGVERGFNGGELPVSSPQGALGIVVVPSCGTTPKVGFFFAPHGKAVLVGKPAICISNA